MLSLHARLPFNNLTQPQPEIKASGAPNSIEASVLKSPKANQHRKDCRGGQPRSPRLCTLSAVTVPPPTSQACANPECVRVINLTGEFKQDLQPAKLWLRRIAQLPEKTEGPGDRSLVRDRRDVARHQLQTPRHNATRCMRPRPSSLQVKPH